jgi:hypothetical protein
MAAIKVDFKPLKKTSKRDKQKYLVLLSDQTVIIDTEWEAMRKAVKHCKANKKHIQEILPTYARINAQTTGLTKLLENLEITKSEL